MKKYFAVRSQAISIDMVLLIVRLVVGYAFILHGWGKIQNPMGWMPGDAIPSIFQALAAIAEFGGGIALIFGLIFRLASFGLLCTMTVAIFMHAVAFGHPFVNNTGGPSFEPATVYFLIFLFLFVMGPGRYSLDRKLFGLNT